MRRIAFFTFLLLLSILGGCARVGSPTGGPKDTTPPVLDTAASTPNYSLRFKERKIELVFNEWLALQDAGTQVLVSPPLAKRPQVLLDGKSIVVEFDEKEQLRPNATYSIYFGTAVRDFHEGNIVPDLRFVFSTGDQIDSLYIIGVVNDALTGNPVKNLTVLVHENTRDSAIRTERPLYVGRTLENGSFRIPNMRMGLYRITAIDDVDQNLRWSGQNERIAFADSLFRLTDTNAVRIRLRLYSESGSGALITKNTSQFGRLLLGYRGRPDSVPLQASDTSVSLFPERAGDTLLVWYNHPTGAAWQLYAGRDTVAVRALDRNAFIARHALVPAGGRDRGRASAGRLPPTVVAQNPTRPFQLNFNVPIVGFDTAAWQLTLDSVPLRAFQVRRDSVLDRRVELDYNWPPGRVLQLQLLPGALTDLFGVRNADTLSWVINISTDKQLGSLTLTLQSLVPGRAYVLSLFNGPNVELERRFRSRATEEKFNFPGLPTATYSIRLIEDTNANGKWDGGRFFENQQPERVFNKKLENLRANWELDAVLNAVEPEGTEGRNRQ